MSVKWVGCNNFKNNRFKVNAFIYFRPMQRCQNVRGSKVYRAFNYSTSNRILHKPKTISSKFQKTAKQWVTVAKSNWEMEVATRVAVLKSRSKTDTMKDIDACIKLYLKCSKFSTSMDSTQYPTERASSPLAGWIKISSYSITPLNSAQCSKMWFYHYTTVVYNSKNAKNNLVHYTQ